MFNPHCRLCPRLAGFLDETQRNHPDYFCRPVPPFGDGHPRLLIIGLAPGKHGANRTGRPFTGDFAGILLYQTLFALGLSNQPTSDRADDPLLLRGVRISNAVKCLPPDNKPTPEEVATCNQFLKAEVAALPHCRSLLVLGLVAHKALLKALDLRASAYPFGHGNHHLLPDGRQLWCSYHCSRYNTQTKRLTEEMFRSVVASSVAND